MSDQHKPERNSPHPNPELTKKLRVDHDTRLSERVLETLEYIRAEGDRTCSFNYFLGRLLDLDSSLWFDYPQRQVQKYQLALEKVNPDFLEEYELGVAGPTNRINPTQIIERVMKILVVLHNDNKIRLLEPDPDRDYLADTAGMYILFRSDSFTDEEDTQEMEALDPAMMILDEDSILLGPADTQPFQPLR